MSELKEAISGGLAPAQAAELSLLVDLEARWENLRQTSPGDLEDLHDRQKAYDAFHTKLVAYNKRYRPAHVPELLLNTPSRLRLWCRAMRDLYLQVKHDPRGHCPAHLLEKAYRRADRIGARMNKDQINRATPPGTIRDVIGELEVLGQWCDRLTSLPATV
jgi:hypothetical protein